MDASGVLQLVGEPHRWELLVLLGESDLRVSELVARTGTAQNLVSYHLRELRTAGLVSSRRSAADGRDSYYRLDLDRYAELVGSAASTLHPGVRLVPAEPVFEVVARRRPRVLFLCTGNSARSQIAEALAQHLSGGSVEAVSAGSHPKPLHPNAVRVLATHGIDIAGRRSKHLRRYARTRFDRVVTLCDKVREVCPELPGSPAASHWSIADPSLTAPDAIGADTYPAFEAAYADIDARVRLLLARLAATTEEARHAHR